MKLIPTSVHLFLLALPGGLALPSSTSSIIAGSLNMNPPVINGHLLHGRRAPAAVPCDPVNPMIGTIQTDCPKKLQLAGEQCPTPDKPDGLQGCAKYCEESITFTFGREAYLDNADPCNEGDECEIKDGTQVSTSIGYSFNAGIETGFAVPGTALESAFNFGASYTWTKSVTYSFENTKKKGSEKRMGYWAWIPLLVKSCGTLTIAEEIADDSLITCNNPTCPGRQADPTCSKDKKHTAKAWCQEPAFAKFSNGGDAGFKVFVAQCIKNDEPNKGSISPCQDGQDPRYYFPGVSRDPEFEGEWPPPARARQG